MDGISFNLGSLSKTVKILIAISVIVGTIVVSYFTIFKKDEVHTIHSVTINHNHTLHIHPPRILPSITYVQIPDFTIKPIPVTRVIYTPKPQPPPTSSSIINGHTYTWISVKAISESQLTVAGYEDRKKLYISRMKVLGKWLPGKALVEGKDSKLQCYIPFRSKEETSKTDFDILSSSDGTFTWYPTSDKNIPQRAIVGGYEPYGGETVYICRAFWKKNHFVVGKLLRNYGSCFLPHWGEKMKNEYEVLIENKCSGRNAPGSFQWVQFRYTSVSSLTPVGKQDDLNIYIARAKHNGKYVPGKAHYHKGVLIAYICHEQQEYMYTDFEVLKWTPGKLVWVGTANKNIPAGAVYGGLDPTTGETTYVCRGFYDGHLVTGKVIRSFGVCFLPFYGEHRVTEFDVLVENTCGT